MNTELHLAAKALRKGNGVNRDVKLFLWVVAASTGSEEIEFDLGRVAQESLMSQLRAERVLNRIVAHGLLVPTASRHPARLAFTVGEWR